MRLVTSLILALSFVLPMSHPAFAGAARSSAALEAANAYVTKNARFTLIAPKLDSKKLAASLQEAAVAKPKEAAVGVGQTLLLIMTLTAIDLTHQEIKNRKGKGTFKASDLANIASVSVSAILDNPSIYAGILGAGGIGVAQKPASLLTKILTQPKLLRALRPLLTKLVTTTVTFVGWEFGSQLWTEASLRLQSDADVKRATSVSGLGGGLARTFMKAGSTEDRENARVANLMAKEMVYILLHAPTLRAWFDNTLRTRVMTGEFSTLLTSMIAAGTIGTAIFPGAGTVAGALFGLAGGVVAMFLPQGFKDNITDRFQVARAWKLQYSMMSNRLTLEDSIVPVRFIWAASKAEVIAQARKALQNRHALRSKLATIYWEKLRRTVLRFNEKQLTDDQFNSQFESLYTSVVNIYKNDIREIAKLSLLCLDSRPPSEIPKLIEIESTRLKLLVRYHEEFKANADFDVFLKMIEVNYAKGVDETEVLKLYVDKLRALNKAS